MFGTLLERPILRSQVSSKYTALVEMFNVELDRAKLVFDAQLFATDVCGGVPPICKNMPHVAGQLKWAQELRDRIQAPMKSFRSIDHP